MFKQDPVTAPLQWYKTLRGIEPIKYSRSFVAIFVLTKILMILFCQNHLNYWVGMTHSPVFVRAASLALKQLHGYPSGGKGIPKDVSNLASVYKNKNAMHIYWSVVYICTDLQK